MRLSCKKKRNLFVIKKQRMSVSEQVICHSVHSTTCTCTCTYTCTCILLH